MASYQAEALLLARDLRVAYRKHDYGEARKGVLQCMRIGREKLTPMSEVLAADLHFRLAAIARQESKLDDAIHSYGECLVGAFELLKRKRSGGWSSLAPEDTLATRYLIAKTCALGLGYCFIEKGMLREARIVITTGQMLLWETADVLNLQYCELLFARLLRHSAGRDPNQRQQLFQAKEILQKCLSASAKHRPRLANRVHYELGFVELYFGHFRDAEKRFGKVLEAAKSERDVRWECNGMIALARLRFYQAHAASTPTTSRDIFDQSLALAIEAETTAKHAHQDWAQARAVTMQARVEMALAVLPSTPEKSRKQLLREAKRHLESVIRTGELSNPSVRAFPLLLLARLYRLDGDVARARTAFVEWSALKDQVQHAAVHALAREIEQEVFPKEGDFVVSAELPDNALNREQLALELERYLFTRLEHRQDLTDAAKALSFGLGRTAYLRRRKQIMGF